MLCWNYKVPAEVANLEGGGGSILFLVGMGGLGVSAEHRKLKKSES